MTRAELVEKAKALGIKYIAKKNMQVLAEEIKALSKSKPKSKTQKTTKPKTTEPKKTTKTTKPKKTTEPKTKKSSSMSPKEVMDAIKAKSVLAKAKLSHIKKGQIYCIWYDEPKDQYIVIMDVATVDGQGGFLAMLVELSSTNNVKTAKHMSDSIGEDITAAKFTDPLKKKYKKATEIYRDL